MTKHHIIISGPKDDGTHVVEFRTSDGETLAIPIPRTEMAVIQQFQERMPYGLCLAKRKTPEEIAEENERTNERALFNFADSYLASAKHLIEFPPPERLRFPAPIDFLLYHAAELYLKSYLRQKGEDVDALRKLGHSHQRLGKKAARHGMNIPSEIYDIFAFLDETDAVIESRYILTGPKTGIQTNALLEAVLEVRKKVKSNHEAAGVTLAATKALP
jgi:HEPN domain